MEFEQIERLVNLVSSSNLTSMELEEGNLKLVMKKEKKVMAASATEKKAQTVIPSVMREEETDVKWNAAEELSNADEVIIAPLVGTFYSASGEDVTPFVSVGDQVKKGQVLGIIEAMKLMNEIECELDGKIEAILVENGNLVEYGQPLFRISKL